MHIEEEERKLIVEGMQESLAKVATEIKQSLDLSMEVTGNPSENLQKRLQETLNVRTKFETLAREKPWTF